ncbi:MAG: pyridoxal phosphate-dependent aminotransferase [Dehalococcoidia bacterium]|nr:pyridoxal phosphate-dependent aminotransferase [Dehalococcoidia bacterium]
MKVADRTESFQESVIRKMTRVCQRYQGINLAQGFPEKDPPEEVVSEVLRAIQQGSNQYSITWGLPALREAVAAKYSRFAGLNADPEREVTITCGCSEAIVATLMGLVNPGERVIIFEPFYENYLPGLTLCGGIPEYVRLRDPNWTLDMDELKRAFSKQPKAMILNSPCNPSGKVFSREEMETIAGFCREHGTIVITDEIYEHILYDGLQHTHMATLPGMWEQTVTISGISKTYSATGWRVGYVVAHHYLMSAIRKCHDYMVVCAPTPFQMGAVVAMGLPDSYYQELQQFYRERRDFLLKTFEGLSIPVYRPEGAYYMMVRIDGLNCGDDEVFAMALAEKAGLAVVPGSSFYHNPEDGRDKVRFCFAKKWETLNQIGERLEKFLGS